MHKVYTSTTKFEKTTIFEQNKHLFEWKNSYSDLQFNVQINNLCMSRHQYI